MNAWLQNAALWLWQNSLAAAALALLVLGMRQAFRGRIAPRWLYLSGWLVMARLFLPSPLTHPWAWDRAWAQEDSVVNAETAFPPLTNIVGSETAVSVLELRAEIAAARSTLEAKRASGMGNQHPQVITAGSTLTAREQALAVLVPNPTTPRVNWLGAAVWTWAGGAAAYFLYTLGSHVRFMRRLRRSAEMLTTVARASSPEAACGLEARATVEECAAVAGLRRVPSLLSVPGNGSPFLCGLFRPRIVLPAETLAVLTPVEFRHVLLHEMLHISRRDLAANWLLAAVRALHWWNPLIHFAARRLLADREILRDHQVIALLRDPDERGAYGHTLLKLALPLSAPAPTPGLAPLFHSEKELKRRLTMIQTPIRHRRPASCAAAGILAILCAPLFTTVRGQEKSEPEKKSVPPPAGTEDITVRAPEQAAAVELRHQELNNLAGRLSVLNELKGEQLVAGAFALGGSTTLLKVYPEYQAEVARLGSLSRNGFGPKHPKLLGLRENIRLKYQQIEKAAENYRDGLAIRIAAAKDEVAAGTGDTSANTPPTPADGQPSTGAAQTMPLENLRAVAAKLRERGQTAEADAIEAELKKLAAPDATVEGKAPAISPSAVSASELQQLRAEMAEVKAALAAIRNSSAPADLEDELVRLKLDQLKSGSSGFGPKHPRVIKQKGEIAAIEKLAAERANRMLADETAARKQSDKRVQELKRQGKISEAEAELHSALAAQADAAKSAEAAAAMKQHLHDNKDAMETELKAFRDKLRVRAEAEAEAKEKEAPAPKAEAVKPTDQAGDDLPWGVAVPGKKGRVFSPYSPESAVVDVEGFKKGDQVKCPHTGKFFRVP